MKPELVVSRRGFRPVGKCDWCNEDERALRATFVPEPSWLCGQCYGLIQRGQAGPLVPRGAPFTGERARKHPREEVPA